MSLKITYKPEGFTLIEVLLSVAFLGILAIGISSIYSSGFQAMDDQLNRMLLQGQLKSRMEMLVGMPFSEVASGSTPFTANGQTYTITWSASPTDVSGDSNPESDAKEVIVSISEVTGYTLTTILVDNRGNINRL